MKLISNVLTRFGYIPKREVETRIAAAHASAFQTFSRSFEGAMKNNLTADWNDELKSINEDVRESAQRLTVRAHDLFKNNAYARRYVDLFRMNVVGPDGFNLQSRAGEWTINKDGKPQFVQDDAANAMIEDRFADWSKAANCTVDGGLSFRALQDQLAIYIARDGEFLVRKIYNKSKYAFQLQVLEPHLLDHNLNKDLPNGNFIRMGVEVDNWRRPVAYHLMRRTPKYDAYGTTYYQVAHDRIPATEIYHGFLHEWAFQYRGYSRMAPVMIHLRMLKAWEIAAVVNARQTAERPGWLKKESPQGDAKFPTPEKGADGQPTIPSSIGEYGFLPSGWGVEKPESDYPHQQHEMFVRANLRAIASGLGVSYNMLANDLVGVNYSSIRAGLLDEREQWKGWQRWFIEAFLEPVFGDWLEMATIAGEVKISFAKLDQYNCPVWTGRRWAWVDPLRDVEALVLEREALLKSRTQAVAERGGDFRDVVEQIAREEEFLKSLGIEAGKPEPKDPPKEPLGEEDTSEDKDDEKMQKKLLSTLRRLLRLDPVNGNGTH